jgi:hypothetical protein
MIALPVDGFSEAGALSAQPSTLDFGIVPIGCGASNRLVTLYNTGLFDIEIRAIILDAATTPEITMSAPQTPFRLIPGAYTAIDFDYHPIDEGLDTTLVMIAHSGSTQPLVVPIFGEGRVDAIATEVFTQQAANALDTLFVIDNSCSMSEEQAFLGSNLSAFLSSADAQNIDYHIAVTTTDIARPTRGQFVGTTRVIDRATPNRDQVFSSNVDQGVQGADGEAGLHAAFLALSDPLITGHNAGFLREDAALAIVVVSDEEDQSFSSTAFYEAYYLGIKADPSRVSFHAIVGTTPGGCVGPAGAADHGHRYLDVVDYFGGVKESICGADWGLALENVGAAASALRSRFALGSEPVPGTISVTVNGVQVPAFAPSGEPNWIYEPATNAVAFTAAAIPAESATVEVTYAIACGA